jgi:flagella basal body P-ring formation protein FlgA
MMGKALEKGKKGDIIKIKNVASNKILFAEVISLQKVMIASNL